MQRKTTATPKPRVSEIDQMTSTLLKIRKLGLSLLNDTTANAAVREANQNNGRKIATILLEQES